LLSTLALTGSVVTIDAMHCQKKHSSRPPSPAFI
jgi:predicted transposase YbfD/YdcC